MKMNVVLALAAGTACCTLALGKPPLQMITDDVCVEPLQIAKVKMVNGRIVLDGDWIDYTGGMSTRSPKIDVPAFDCYGRRPGTAGEGLPACTTTTCTLGTQCYIECTVPWLDGHTDAASNGNPCSATRWFYGTGYNNPNTIDDMQDCACPPGSEMSRIQMRWFQESGGPLYIAYFPYEEVVAFDSGTALCSDPAAFTPTGPGVAISFGDVAAGSYRSCVSGLDGLGVLFPSTDDNFDANGYPDGSYQMIIASAVTSTGITLHAGPSQPILWGTSTNGTNDARPGHNNEDAYDDDAPTDGVFSNPSECYSYAGGLCPDPLGKCNVFAYKRCAADYNNDGFVDGIDSDNFNNDFENPDPVVQHRADLNGDCFVDGIDSDYFNNEFESACP